MFECLRQLRGILYIVFMRESSFLGALEPGEQLSVGSEEPLASCSFREQQRAHSSSSSSLECRAALPCPALAVMTQLRTAQLLKQNAERGSKAKSLEA